MTTWWNKNVESRMNDFQSWIGDYNQITKTYCRGYVIEKKYESVLDCGCGAASEYFGYKKDNYNIDYTGLDSCKFLVEKNRKLGIEMIEAELEEPLPILDNHYDCVYSRGVLEHLSDYKNAISEFIRAAKKEVLIGWFIKPDKEKSQINYWQEEDLYHNKYNIEELEEFILDHDSVKFLFWININEKENVLHIILNKEIA